MAYNYGWYLEYIYSSFTEQDLQDLLEDATFFNPMISSRKDTSEDIPAEEREKIRKEWLAKRNARSKS